MELPDLYEGSTCLKPCIWPVNPWRHAFPSFPRKPGTSASDCHAALAFSEHLC